MKLRRKVGLPVTESGTTSIGSTELTSPAGSKESLSRWASSGVLRRPSVKLLEQVDYQKALKKTLLHVHMWKYSSNRVSF